MTVQSKILNDIIRKIENFSEEKLAEVLEYVEGIENLTETQEFFLSFAGNWKDIDSSLFKELTEDLHEKRKRDTREIIK